MPNDLDVLTDNIRGRIEHIKDLPAMPEMATKVLRLKSQENATVEQLVSIVALDPALAAQIIHFANSPLYGQRSVDSITDAIQRVLGFDRVINFVVGVVAGQAFTIPNDGPIGLKALWKDAVYGATLMEMLARAVPKGVPVYSGICYLSGLLRNFGILLLGHLFPKDFRPLSNAIESTPDTPIIEIEKQLLGTDHRELGVWLMRKWGMAPEVIITAYEHHNENYRGQHAIYANLAFVAGGMLKKYSIGDAASDEIPEKLLEMVGLNNAIIQQIEEEFNETHNSLDVLINSLLKKAA